MDSEPTAEPMDVPMATPNMDLVNQTFAAIRADLEHWNQSLWAELVYDKEANACGTSYCFGGMALSLVGQLRQRDNNGLFYAVDRDGNAVTFIQAAREALGFNPFLADVVFHNPSRDIDRFEAQVRDAIETYGGMTVASYYNGACRSAF